jgi:MFS family permease
VFSIALGIASVAVPLLAVASGYSAGEIGLLLASSAVSQMATRLVLGHVMRVLPDWTLIAAAAVMLVGSNALLAITAVPALFVLSQLFQGVARACFWTGSQTHVVRGPGSSVGALASMNFISSAGLLIGPVLAGLLTERSPQLALGVGAAIGVAGLFPVLLLDRLPPFSPPDDRPEGMLWRRPGVSAGCWAGLTTGAWRALLGSYIPVALSQARQSSSTIGVLVAFANASSVVGAGVVGRATDQLMVRAYVVGTIATGAAVAVVGAAAGHAWIAAALLCLSGVGAGALQTLGPAIASDAVHPEERGEAIAAAGTFRAAALLLSPLGVSGLLVVAPLSLAMAAVGVLITVPAVAARGLDAYLRTTAVHD